MKEIGDRPTYFKDDLQKFLEKRGYECKIKSCKEYNDIPNNTIVYVKNPFKESYGHYSLKTSDGTYYDPTIGVIKGYNKDVKIPTHYMVFKKICDE